MTLSTRQDWNWRPSASPHDHESAVTMERLAAERTPYVMATVVRTRRPASARAGDRALVLPDGTLAGFVGGTCAESTVRNQALQLLDSGESALLRITPEPEPETVEGMICVGNPCLSGGMVEVFLETVIPPPLVHVFGDGPIARALAEVGEAAGLEVRSYADPAAPIAPDTSAVVVASHGRAETGILLAAVHARVPYIGLVASPRRGAAVLAELDLPEAEAPGDRPGPVGWQEPGGRSGSVGWEKPGGRSGSVGWEKLVRSPAGLDIGAHSPAEIAVSIIAEIISLRPRPETPGAAGVSGSAAGHAGAGHTGERHDSHGHCE